jgi:hypothetical protein
VGDAAIRADLDNTAVHTFHGLRAGRHLRRRRRRRALHHPGTRDGWTILAMVFRYWRRGSAWANNALDDVGL